MMVDTPVPWNIEPLNTGLICGFVLGVIFASAAWNSENMRILCVKVIKKLKEK